MNNDIFSGYLAGNFELAVGDVVIPPRLLGDIVPNYQEGTVTANTQAGTTTTPTGKAETAELTTSIFLPATGATELLARIWPESYTAPTGDTQKSGNIQFGSKACQTRTPVPVNIHNVCDTTDDNDIYFPAALALIQFNPTFSTSDVVQVDITFQAQEDENGLRMRVGTGDPTQPSKYDPTTQKTVPATSA